MTTPAPPANAKSGSAQAPVAQAPFRSGTQRTLSTDGYTNSTTPGTGSVDLPDYTPSPNNYLRGVWIESKGTTASNAATVAFNGDGPFSAYSSITFQDANEKPIVGPFDGYTLMLVNKFGAYQNLGDPRASAVYSAVAGVGSGAGGSWYFNLYVPLEIINRDGLGALQNQSSASTFTLKLTLNSVSNIYTTAPTTAPTILTKIYEDGWWKSNQAGASSTPPKAGSTQYWTRGSYNALSGSEQFQVSQGLGYPIRSYLLVNYDSSANTRAAGDADFPDPFQLIFKGTSEWQVGKSFWKDQMSRWFSYYSTAADSANGLEAGVFVLPYHISFSNEPGSELAHAYKATNQGDYNQFLGNWTANSKLFVISNYVAFVGAAPTGANGA